MSASTQVRSMRDVQAERQQIKDDQQKRQREADWQHLSTKYIKPKRQAVAKGRVCQSKTMRCEWEELVSSFILQHYWIKTPVYAGEDSDEMFSCFLKNYNDQILIKRVQEAARLADVTVPTPVKGTISPCVSLMEFTWIEQQWILMSVVPQNSWVLQ